MVKATGLPTDEAPTVGGEIATDLAKPAEADKRDEKSQHEVDSLQWGVAAVPDQRDLHRYPDEKCQSNAKCEQRGNPMTAPSQRGGAERAHAPRTVKRISPGTR